jgi:HSP20 family molecular chaperone IbpA
MTLTYVHTYPPHGKVVEKTDEYVVELNVAEFTENEIAVSVDGDVVTVTGNQVRSPDEWLSLSERLEESFRLPLDANAEALRVQFDEGTLELHIPRHRFAVKPDATPC